MLFLLWLLFAGTTAFIASHRNRSGLGWFVLGFLFGPFALIAVCAIPALPSPEGPQPQPAISFKGSAANAMLQSFRPERRDGVIGSRGKGGGET